MVSVETLKTFQAVVFKDYTKRMSEIETRRKWYERTAERFLGKPVDVKFLTQPVDEVGTLLNGSIAQIHGRFVIELRSNRPIQDERFTFAHEVAHGGLGHAADGTLEEYRQGGITKEVFVNGKMNSAIGIDAKKIYEEAVTKQESEANRIALQLYRLLWPE